VASSTRRTLAGLIVLVLFCVLFGVITPPFGLMAPFQAGAVPSVSMLPTLVPGDFMIIDKYFSFRPPRRGDVVAFKYPRDESVRFVKRIVGLGDERLVVRGRGVYVDCRPSDAGCMPLDEPYAYYDDRAPSPPDVGPLRIPPDAYFVLSDNRNVGEDSRSFGSVTRDQLVGRALFIYWSWDSGNGEKPLWQRVRWERVGSIVR